MSEFNLSHWVFCQNCNRWKSAKCECPKTYWCINEHKVREFIKLFEGDIICLISESHNLAEAQKKILDRLKERAGPKLSSQDGVKVAQVPHEHQVGKFDSSSCDDRCLKCNRVYPDCNLTCDFCEGDALNCSRCHSGSEDVCECGFAEHIHPYKNIMIGTNEKTGLAEFGSCEKFKPKAKKGCGMEVEMEGEIVGVCGEEDWICGLCKKKPKLLQNVTKCNKLKEVGDD